MQITLPLQLAFDLAQRVYVIDRVSAEGALEQFGIDVLDRRTGIVLTQRVFELIEIGDVLQRRCRVAQAQRHVAAHALASAPVELRPPSSQLVGQSSHLARHAGVLHCLHHQLGELGLLFGRQRVHQPLRGSRASSERVDELFE